MFYEFYNPPPICVLIHPWCCISGSSGFLSSLNALNDCKGCPFVILNPLSVCESHRGRTKAQPQLVTRIGRPRQCRPRLCRPRPAFCQFVLHRIARSQWARHARPKLHLLHTSCCPVCVLATGSCCKQSTSNTQQSRLQTASDSLGF